MNHLFVGKILDSYSIDSEKLSLMGCCKVMLCHIPEDGNLHLLVI